MRKIDKLGRIVIPQELRKKYGLVEGARIEFFDAGEGITVKPSDSLCKLCRGTLPDGATLALCAACMAEVVRVYQEK